MSPSARQRLANIAALVFVTGGYIWALLLVWNGDRAALGVYSIALLVMVARARKLWSDERSNRSPKDNSLA